MSVLLGFDHVVESWVVAHRSNGLDAVMLTLSAVGRGGMMFLAIGAIVLGLRANWRRLTALVITLVLAWAVSDVFLKRVVGRERPFVQNPTIAVLGGKPDDNSFPSGHATCDFGAALVLSASVPEARLLWWLLAAAVGYSRVYLGVHYPLDVIGGAAVGLCCGAAALAIVKRVAR
jgi:undecaprenyl-diphosphatase